MTDGDKSDLEAALQSIASMIERSEKAQSKFAVGTSQHTLQINRIHALHIALALIEQELAGSAVCKYTAEDFEKARAPLASLISKSEKAQTKLTTGTWQHTMLENNLKALHQASLLLYKAINLAGSQNGISI